MKLLTIKIDLASDLTVQYNITVWAIKHPIKAFKYNFYNTFVQKHTVNISYFKLEQHNIAKK